MEEEKEEKKIYDIHEAARILGEFVDSKEMADRKFYVDKIASTYIIYQMTRQNIYAYIQENGVSIKRLEFKNLMEGFGNSEVKGLLEHTYP